MSEFVEQPRPRCFPLTLIIDCCAPHTESVPEFLHNLRLSDLYNLQGEFVPMNPETFSAMRAGNRAFLLKMRSYGTPMACLKNDKGDTILHHAAALGHVKLVERIISEWPSLLLEPNWKDQIPLHAAARAGRLAVVKTLVASLTYFSARILSAEEREGFNVFLLKDIGGDTPLHSALKGRHLETALCLVSASNHGSFLENNDGISPFYMAVETRGLAVVKAMLNGLGNNVQGQVNNLASQLNGRKWLVHAALKAENTGLVSHFVKPETKPSTQTEALLVQNVSIGPSTQAQIKKGKEMDLQEITKPTSPLSALCNGNKIRTNLCSTMSQSTEKLKHQIQLNNRYAVLGSHAVLCH